MMEIGKQIAIGFLVALGMVGVTSFCRYLRKKLWTAREESSDEITDE